MISLQNDQDGVYTKSKAYAVIKKLLDVDKNVCIKKDFFCIFFREADYPYFVCVCSEQRMRDIFDQHKLKEKNISYWNGKKQGAPPIQLYEQLCKTLYSEARKVAA